MPRLNAGVVLVQHMPRFINLSLQESIARATEMTVVIAQNGDLLESGKVYIAPSERHLKLMHNRYVQLFEGEKVNFVCPSVDVTLLSLKKLESTKIIGVVLSGMGRDGADGIAHVKSVGGITVAQNEETSAIFGMPKEAIATGCVDYICSPIEIREKLIQWAGVA